jgi:hypothetical protein
MGQPSVDRRNAVSSNDEERHRIEAVGRDIRSPDEIMLLEENRFERWRAARGLHCDMRCLDKGAASELLPREPSLAPNDCAKFLFENDLERMLREQNSFGMMSRSTSPRSRSRSGPSTWWRKLNLTVEPDFRQSDKTFGTSVARV